MSRVLIVEDEEQVRVLAEGVIRDMGHETLTAGNVDEAAALLESDVPIDLLFADIHLLDDHHGGVGLAKYGRESRPELRVLYTTGRGVNDGTRALFVDPHHFVGKPYTIQHLIVAVTNALAHAA